MENAQSQNALIELPAKPTEKVAAKRYDFLLSECEKHVFEGLKTLAPKPETMQERVTIAQMIAHYRSIGSVTTEMAEALIAASHKGRYELALSERTKVEIKHCRPVADEANPGQWGQRQFQRLKTVYNGKEYRIYHSGYKPGSAGATKFPGLTFQELKNSCMVDAQLIETLLKDADGKYKLIATLRVFGLLGETIEWIELQPVTVVTPPTTGTNNSMLVSE